LSLIADAAHDLPPMLLPRAPPRYARCARRHAAMPPLLTPIR